MIKGVELVVVGVVKGVETDVVEGVWFVRGGVSL